MPRKTSQAVTKDTAADNKNESAPRRSGRAVTKQETSGKEASRSRRSSTAAQTAASVADSKTPKGRTSVSSRRESNSPSDSRTRTGREGGSESSSTRNKSSRRNASRINYKESDGEDETATPKYEENFESNEEFEDSESDEKLKPRGRSRSSKVTPKTRSPKEKSKGMSRSRRGRPSKKKENEEEEENETIEVSEDSIEPEETPSKRGRATKTPPAKESPKPARSRRQRSETAETKNKLVAEEKPKQSRRSSRTSSSKEETPKKRPSRSIQAKRYTEEEEEDDEEEVEEITENKPDEEDGSKKEVETGRKRKRISTPEEPNKRLKEMETKQQDEGDEAENKEEEDSPIEEDKKVDTKSIDEPMEIDEFDSLKAESNKESQNVVKEEKIKEKIESKIEDTSDLKEEKIEEKVEEEEEMEPPEEEDMEPPEEEDVEPPEEEGIEPPEEAIKAEEKQEIVPSVKEKQNELLKPESIDSSENLDESIHSSDSDQASQPEQSVSSGLDYSPAAKEIVNEIAEPSTMQPPKVEVSPEKPKEVPPQTPVSQAVEKEADNTQSSSPLVVSENIDDESKRSLVLQVKKDIEPVKNDSCVSEENETSPVDKVSTIPSSESSIPVTPVTVIQSKEPISDTSLNGAEKNVVTNSASETHTSANMNIESAEQNIPKANGAHNDVQHTNSTSPSKEQYYSLPGRRYVINSKLNENLRQSLKNQTFGFASYNMGTVGPDAYIQKDKLFNELNKLDAHLICLQQVAKPFYSSVLEPSLDALGFKSIFSQPEDSLKGMVTFYKSSLFRLCDTTTVSLKQLVEKDLEVSSLEAADKAAVKAHIRRCGSVLFCHFATVIGSQTITVANVQIPPTDLSIHALQVSCLAREIVRINDGTNKPLLIGGEFNIAENDAPYQLLKDGYLNNEMIEELQRRKDVVLPEKENASLINLLWKSFQHPSSSLCSCYSSVLGHEFFIPEIKSVSPDLVWYSSDSLHTVGVLDAISNKPGDCHYSLKADIAFAV